MEDPALDLETLRRRWREEGSPQLAMRLAEAASREGETEEALTVLGQDLEAHPGHVAARVARGRLLARLERHAEAASDLEQVVEADPTHLLANKLLVESYASLGATARARDRLDLYALFSGDDPEIDELRRRIEEAGEPAAGTDADPETAAPGDAADVAPADPPQAAAAPPPEEAPSAAPEREAPAAAAPPPEKSAPPVRQERAPADAAPADAGAEYEPPAAPSRAVSARPGRRGHSAATRSDPFPTAWSGLDAAEYMRRLAGEGLFALGATEPRAVPAARRPRDRSHDRALTAGDLADAATLAALPNAAARRAALLRGYLERIRPVGGSGV